MTYSYAVPTRTQTLASIPFIWRVGSYGSCNASCGGGVQSRTVICVQESTETIVDDTFCDAASRPVSRRVCNNVVCRSQWNVADDWSTCSKTCGGGVKTRLVVCVRQDSPTTVLNDYDCRKKAKPRSSRPCSVSSCPMWKLGSWSQVEMYVMRYACTVGMFLC